jgi:probable HAF family extracellular repeat protein
MSLIPRSWTYFAPHKLCRILWLAALVVAAVHGSRAQAGPPHYSIEDRGLSLVRTLVNTPGLNSHGDLAIWDPQAAGAMKGVVYHGQDKTGFTGDKDFSLVYPADINDQEMVAGSLQMPQDLRFTRAFRWSHGTLEVLDSLGGSYSAGNAINNAGHVAGSAQLRGAAKHAVLWRTKEPLDLGLLPGGDYSNARDINDQDEVVGDANVIANGRPNAFAWYGGQMHRLPELSRSTFCSAQALNHQGEIIGSCDLPNGSAHGVIWRGGHAEDLGTLGDDDAPSTALDINRRTQVVGSSEIEDGMLRAFLWQHGRMYDLNTAIAPRSGWVLLAASRINDAGEIAGRGFYKGAIHAFLLRPVPAPGKK